MSRLVRFGGLSLFALASTLLAASVGLADAESSKVHLFEVLRRPEYPQAYDRMLKGENSLPYWFNSARAAGYGTAGAGAMVRIDADDQELYSFCEPHNCSGHFFAVLFSREGQRAVGASDIGGNIRLYGDPTTNESAVLMKSLKSSE